MTDDLLARARAALEGVTGEGAWETLQLLNAWFVVDDTRRINVVSGCEFEGDARFIAATRELVPALVAEVERLRDRIGDLEFILYDGAATPEPQITGARAVRTQRSRKEAP